MSFVINAVVVTVAVVWFAAVGFYFGGSEFLLVWLKVVATSALVAFVGFIIFHIIGAIGDHGRAKRAKAWAAETTPEDEFNEYPF